jgi:hypothetical protein
MCVCVFLCCVVLCFDRGLVLDWSPNQGVLPNVCGSRSPLRKAKVLKDYRSQLKKKKANDSRDEFKIRTAGYRLLVYKIKLSLCFNWAPRHEGVLGSGDIVPLILWPWYWMEVSGQLHAPAALPQGKSPWYTLDRRLGGPQSRSGLGGEEKNSQLPRLRTRTNFS